MLTRVVSGLYGGRRAGSFAGRGSGAHPVGELTRVVSGLYGGRLAGSFTGKSSGGSTHPVGELTRVTSGLWGARLVGSFAGRGVITPEEVAGGFKRKRIEDEEEMMYMVAAMLPLIIRRMKWHKLTEQRDLH